MCVKGEEKMILPYAKDVGSRVGIGELRRGFKD